MQPPDTAREEPQRMSFVSVNSERDTIKSCALFLLACATADTSKESKRDDWSGKNVKSVDALHVLSHQPSLFFISLSNAWLAGYVMSGFETMPTVFSLGFHCCKRKLKLDNEKQWKIYLKWIELKTRTFQLLYARENKKKISQEARGSDGGEGEWGEGGVVAGFDQDANKCMTSTGISYLVISFAL